MRDKVPRDYGEQKRPVPSGALHAKQILPEPNQLFLLMRKDKVHFYNPQEAEGVPPSKRAACFAITAEAEQWANGLVEDYERGSNPWLMDWDDQPSVSP